MPDTFQHRFIEAMNIRGLRQVDVAERSGLDKAQISQYKNGKYEPMQDALYKLAQALNVNVAWLMGHDVPMEINRKELEQKERVCDLLEKCYGSGAYELVELFAKLNETGKIRSWKNCVIQLHYQNILSRKKGTVKKWHNLPTVR